ncbi:MAG: CDP-alcohol phosphatidyltransferase family protein [Oscillospiraceae bacterium]|nr:CDP-alcohol phosphatidyltransferase family protein [Oscillospiraceae bacterium]
MKIKKIGYYDYTVILTYLGMLLACFGIFQVMDQQYWTALFCLMAAGVCDMFDGTVAKTKQRDADEKRFGVQIDSLSDLISFGVFPAVFVYQLSGRQKIAGLLAALYILAGLIRLAYFNVLEERRQQENPEQKSSFLGVPITTIAILLPVAYLLYDYHLFRNTAFFTLLLCMTGAGFLTPVEIKKPDIFGKITLIIVGVIEAAFMLLFMGWDAV